jgi:hypothetical protein
MTGAIAARILDEVAVCGTTEQVRQMWSARDAEGLAGDVGFLAPRPISSANVGSSFTCERRWRRLACSDRNGKVLVSGVRRS